MGNRIIVGLVVVMAGLTLATAPLGARTTATGASWNVRNFGARGDGLAKDTAAFQQALQACATNHGGTVIVPAGNYLIGSIIIGGNTTLRFESNAVLTASPDIADYPLEEVRWEGEFVSGHRALISGRHAGRVAICGPGAIHGPPPALSRLRTPRGPVLIELTDCTNTTLDGFSTQYQQLWSIHLLFCRDFTIRNLVIRSTGSNGDGIDVDSCTDALIDHCDMDTGDDAISLKSGRGLAAVRLNRPTQNVVIRNCSLVSSMFGGIGIGTEISGGVRDVRLEHCFISGHQNGIFIKSRDGRGGFMEDIVGQDLVISNSPTFLCINLLNKGIQSSDPVPGDADQWSRVRNLTFSNVRVDDVRDLVAGSDIPPEQPLDGLTLTHITGTCERGIVLSNSKGVKLASIDVTGFRGPLVTTSNVQGVGLDKPSHSDDRSAR